MLGRPCVSLSPLFNHVVVPTRCSPGSTLLSFCAPCTPSAALCALHSCCQRPCPSCLAPTTPLSPVTLLFTRSRLLTRPSAACSKQALSYSRALPLTPTCKARPTFSTLPTLHAFMSCTNFISPSLPFSQPLSPALPPALLPPISHFIRSPATPLGSYRAQRCRTFILSQNTC